MGFEKFVPKVAVSSRPKALLRPTGLISFGAPAVSAFGLDKATHAVLFFDRNKKAIGVKFTSNPKEEGAVKVSRRRSTVGIKAPQFFEEYGLLLEDAKGFPVSEDRRSGMVTIDVRDVKRRRGRRAAKP